MSEIAHLRELIEERFTAQDKALTLQAQEYARRLEVLNHAHEAATLAQRTFVGREAYEALIVRTETRIARLETFQARLLGLALATPIISGLAFYLLSLH